MERTTEREREREWRKRRLSLQRMEKKNDKWIKNRNTPAIRASVN